MHDRTMQKRNATFGYVLAAALLLGNSACYANHMYQIGGPGDRELGNLPSTEWEAKTLNTYLWGAVRQDLPVDNCKLGDGTRLGIEEIKIEKNFGHVLGTIFTLGIWNPVKVSWRCAKPQPITDTLD